MSMSLEARLKLILGGRKTTKVVVFGALLMTVVSVGLITKALPVSANGGGINISSTLKGLVTPAVYDHMDQYDNYDPSNASYTGDPACYVEDNSHAGIINFTHTPFTNYVYDPLSLNGPDGNYGNPPFLADQEVWATPATQPNIPSLQLDTTNNTLTQSLQVNALSFACQLQTTGVYFPNEIPSGFTSTNDSSDWYVSLPPTQRIASRADTYVLGIGVVGGSANGSVSIPNGTITATYDDSHLISIPAHHNSKYWFGNTMPFSYTPPAGGITSNTNVQVNGTARSMNVVQGYLTGDPTLHYFYQCIGDTTSTTWTDLSAAWEEAALSDPLNDEAYCPMANPSFAININFQTPQATCGSVSVPAGVAAGQSFSVGVTMDNPSGSTPWTTLAGYHLTNSFNGGSTSNTALSFADSTGVPGGSSASFTLNYTAPTPPSGGQNYTGTYRMAQGNNLFGNTCTFTVNVQRVYDYVPGVDASSVNISGAPMTVTGGPGIPGAIINVATSGQQITVTPKVANNCDPATCLSNGDTPTITTYEFSGTYQYGVGPTITSTVNLGSYTIPNGVAPGATVVSPTSYVRPPIPKGTTDGTFYCYYSQVTPANRLDPTGSTSTAPNILNRFSSDAGTFASVWDNTTNDNTNDTCFDVENARYPTLNVSQGDVHAGGAVGTSCSGTTVNGDFIKTNPGTVAEYVGTAASNPNQLSTTGSNSQGPLSAKNYGTICRPDLAKVAQSYYTTPMLLGSVYGNPATPLNLINIAPPAGQNSVLYQAQGDLYVEGIVRTRVTLYVPHGNVYIVGPITEDSNYADSSGNTLPNDINHIPSLGIITNGSVSNQGNIYIAQNASTVDAFLVAQGNPTLINSGSIHTCTEHIQNNTTDCNVPLLVNGFMMANSFVFGRTATQDSSGNPVYAETVRQSPLLYLSPPPGFETQPNSASSLPQYGGESLPFF